MFADEPFRLNRPPHGRIWAVDDDVFSWVDYVDRGQDTYVSSYGPIPATNYDRHPKVDGRTANHTLADEVRPSRPDLSHYDLDLYIASLTTE